MFLFILMSHQLITFNDVFSYCTMMLGENCVMLAKVIEARREDEQMITFAGTLALILLPNTIVHKTLPKTKLHK